MKRITGAILFMHGVIAMAMAFGDEDVSLGLFAIKHLVLFAVGAGLIAYGAELYGTTNQSNK